MAFRNDCPQDRLLIRTTDHDSVMGIDLPLLGPIADLPEFHDCQRFVLPSSAAGVVTAPSSDSLGFGPLVAIWAANKLDSSFAAEDSLKGKAVPVAVFYNFDRNHGYSPLGIDPGFSCLFLWNDGTWHAKVVALGKEPPDKSDPTRCLKPVELAGRALAGGTTLKVVSAALPDLLKPADIPPVARWDWDRTTRQQYIGIRCGDQWCDIGSADFVPAKPAEGSPEALKFLAAIKTIPGVGVRQATEVDRLRTVAVSGWYDTQRLDLRSWTGKLSMSDVSGIVFPQPALDSVPLEAYDSVWVPTAYVVLDGEYDGEIPMAAGVSRIELCNGSASVCEVPGDAKHCEGVDRSSMSAWWGRVIPETGAPYYHCVKRRTHDGEAIPVAVARWNWSEKDAKTWSRCGDACCTGN